ncbi:hypothetical protein ACWGOQ_0008775 [Aquimarina sp. M1]
MKYKMLLFLLLLITSKHLTAQESLKPFVNHYSDNLILENLPAISEDGFHYLVEYSAYSCCIDLGTSLKKIGSAEGKVIREIIISPNEEADPFTVTKRQSIYESVNNILENDTYYTLTMVEKFKVVNEGDIDGMYVSVHMDAIPYTSEKFTLPRIMSHGFCCNGGIDIDENCLLYQNVIAVYLSVKRKVFLIETGLRELMDGCDQGPFYTMIPISCD